MAGVNVMGIDPGKHGGIAILSERDGLWLEPMPILDDEIDIKELNRLISDHARDLRVAYLEKPPIMPKNGAIALMKLGRAFGIVEGVLIANGVPTVRVTPQEWMACLHAGAPGTMDTKTRSKLAFASMFPIVDARKTAKSSVPHDGMVEAALIAEFGRRQGF